MSMTKKDYVLIAEAVRLTRQSYSDYDGDIINAVISELVGRLCIALTTDNPRFNQIKFIEATKAI